MSWYALKAQISQFTHLEGAYLHIHAGLFLFLIFSVLLRNKTHRWLAALVLVAALEFANEALDVFDWINGIASPNWQGGLLDVVNTLFWPGVLTLMAKARLM